jgi:transposase
VIEPLPDENGALPQQNLCADAGYTGKVADQAIRDHGYVPHVKSRKEEHAAKISTAEYKPRRWVVEVCHSWFSRFRKLLVRYEKTVSSFLALHHLAAAIIAFRKVVPLYGPYSKRTP